MIVKKFKLKLRSIHGGGEVTAAAGLDERAKDALKKYLSENMDINDPFAVIEEFEFAIRPDPVPQEKAETGKESMIDPRVKKGERP